MERPPLEEVGDPGLYQDGLFRKELRKIICQLLPEALNAGLALNYFRAKLPEPKHDPLINWQKKRRE
jgi:hypothetical protein